MVKDSTQMKFGLRDRNMQSWIEINNQIKPQLSNKCSIHIAKNIRGQIPVLLLFIQYTGQKPILSKE